MNIERDEKIHFHELGTLISVTRWIRTHDEGVAEWLKNSRRAYQPDRANVAEEHRTAALLEQAVKQIIEHPVFRDWLKDPTRPKYFREAGHFWGITDVRVPFLGAADMLSARPIPAGGGERRADFSNLRRARTHRQIPLFFFPRQINSVGTFCARGPRPWSRT